MDKVQEMRSKLEGARSWKEAGITIAEMLKALEELSSNDSNKSNPELDKLRAKVERLTESNKQLMSENKKLKGNR